MKYKGIGQVIDQDIEHGVGASTCQVAESLDRYDPRKRLVEEINSPYNDISGKCKQQIKISANVR